MKFYENGTGYPVDGEENYSIGMIIKEFIFAEEVFAIQNGRAGGEGAREWEAIKSNQKDHPTRLFATIRGRNEERK